MKQSKSQDRTGGIPEMKQNTEPGQSGQRARYRQGNGLRQSKKGSTCRLRRQTEQGLRQRIDPPLTYIISMVSVIPKGGNGL
jgi:hypothetical protein